jgi:PKD repeat protein
MEPRFRHLLLLALALACLWAMPAQMVYANNPPVLEPIGSQSVSEGSFLGFHVAASDPDGDALAYLASSLPPGAAFDPVTGLFSWTPQFDQAGTYEVTFTVTDGLMSDSEVVTIIVADTNRPPLLEPIGNQSVSEGNLISFNVAASDPDGDAVTFSADLSALPPGAAFDPAAGLFTWTPQYGQAGTYAVVFTVTDSGSISDSETVTIFVVSAGALKGKLQYSEESGWSLQTAAGTVALPDDELGQYVEGLKAKVKLRLEAGEPQLVRYKLLYPGFGVDLKLNRPVFNLTSTGVADIPYVVMGLRVYNQTCRPVTFHFTTSQRYDFEITDGSGTPLWRWSTGKGFLDVVGEETVVCNGPPLTYFAKFPLFDGTGQPTLAPGLYRLRGWLTDNAGPDSGSMEATVTFQVK